MSKKILNRIEKELKSLQEINRFRTLKDTPSDEYHNLASNSYLNLHKSKEVQKRAAELVHTFSGNGASRLVQSHSPLFKKLETLIAEWKGTEAALLFNSGYAANTGILQAIGRKGVEIYSDRLNHASIVDGIRLSGAKMIRYNHCDMSDLRKKISRSDAKEKVIVTDSIFSMDGDRAPLTEIAALGKEFDALTMVDEAHSTGLYGKRGSGLVESLGLTSAIDIKMGTLSKAVCGTGGFFAGSQLLKDYFVNCARPLIFSTALAESNLAWNIAAIEEIQNQTSQTDLFHLRSAQFIARLRKARIECGNSSCAIIPIHVGEERGALDLSAFLKSKGFIAPAIRPPTVPNGSCRVRLSLHSGLKNETLDTLYTAIVEYFHG